MRSRAVSRGHRCKTDRIAFQPAGRPTIALITPEPATYLEFDGVIGCVGINRLALGRPKRSAPRGLPPRDAQWLARVGYESKARVERRPGGERASKTGTTVRPRLWRGPSRTSGRTSSISGRAQRSQGEKTNTRCARSAACASSAPVLGCTRQTGDHRPTDWTTRPPSRALSARHTTPSTMPTCSECSSRE